MKRPILNERQRYEMRFDSLSSAFTKLNLSILYFRREIHRGLEPLMNIFIKTTT